AGRVRLRGERADKPGRLTRADAPLEVVGVSPFVGRGGEKLAAALDVLGVAPADRVCLDVGASTGGFTDCLLQRGARHVYAVDVASPLRGPKGNREFFLHLRKGAPGLAPEALEAAVAAAVGPGGES